MTATILQLSPLLLNLLLFNILNFNKVVKFIFVFDLFDFSSGHVFGFHSSDFLVKGVAEFLVHVFDEELALLV